jgi:single-strand DNA-binding protein
MSSTSITVIGNIATEPDARSLDNGATMTRFRLASTDRKFNRASATWEDDNTSFYNVTCFRLLGERVGTVLKKGDPVIVIGKIQVKRWQKTDGSWDGCTDIEAFAVGPDVRRVAITVNRQQRTSAPAEPTMPTEPAVSAQAADVDPWASTVSEPAA